MVKALSKPREEIMRDTERLVRKQLQLEQELMEQGCGDEEIYRRLRAVGLDDEEEEQQQGQEEGSGGDEPYWAAAWALAAAADADLQAQLDPSPTPPPAAQEPPTAGNLAPTPTARVFEPLTSIRACANVLAKRGMVMHGYIDSRRLVNLTEL